MGMYDLSAPTGDLVAVTPNDSTDIELTRGLYVGSGGAIKVDTQRDQAVTLPGLLTGVVYPFRVTRVYSTGTDASDIFAIY
jgi:hypothetical protein